MRKNEPLRGIQHEKSFPNQLHILIQVILKENLRTSRNRIFAPVQFDEHDNIHERETG